MKFRTEIFFFENELEISYSDRILTIGSCFAENIGNYFSRFRFNCLKNPFGVLYNPVSILNSLKLVKSGEEISEDDLVYDQSEYHSFYFHSDFSSHERQSCLSKMNNTLQTTSEYLKNATVAIITLGTSYVYKHLERNIIVSNCHKLPAKDFESILLSTSETVDALKNIIQILREMNREIKVILTVSPIRHWKNGAINNQLSKSNLILSVHETIKKEKDVFYFPSYELLLDDLRDYRFYDEDLLHPSKTATDYIWRKFCDGYFNDNTVKTISRIDKIQKAASHRPRNIHSKQHQKFVSEQLEIIKQLANKYPDINLSDIRKIFESQLVMP